LNVFKKGENCLFFKRLPIFMNFGLRNADLGIEELGYWVLA